jgi:hypothetical protein
MAIFGIIPIFIALLVINIILGCGVPILALSTLSFVVYVLIFAVINYRN